MPEKKLRIRTNDPDAKEVKKSDNKNGRIKKQSGSMGAVILLILAAVFIIVGYLQLSPVEQTSFEAKPVANITVDNQTVISQPLETASGECPLYTTDTAQTFTIQMLHKDKSENKQLQYTLNYRCNCGEDCHDDCGMSYPDLTGSVSVPIVRFSDVDVIDLIIQEEVRESFPLKCTQTQTIVYITDEVCEFSYACYFFGELIANDLSYTALSKYACDDITRTCASIKLKRAENGD